VNISGGCDPKRMCSRAKVVPSAVRALTGNRSDGSIQRLLGDGSGTSDLSGKLRTCRGHCLWARKTAELRTRARGCCNVWAPERGAAASPRELPPAFCQPLQFCSLVAIWLSHGLRAGHGLEETAAPGV
jgi:hypothetical protein